MELRAVHQFLRERRPQIIAEVVALAEQESPSRDAPALAALGERLAGRLSSLGAAVETLADSCGGKHVLGRFAGPAERRPVLVLGHFDTVWPIGTLRRMPVEREETHLRGPGVYDMKASLAMFHGAIEAFGLLGVKPPRPVTVFLSSDEEIGSPGSRPFIEALAREAEHVLVLEPPLADGGLKTARKGVGRFKIEAAGKAAHAGVAPEEGASAILELAHQVLKLQALNDPDAGTSVNVGVIEGGTTVNVVPSAAWALVDVRVKTLAAAAEVERSIRSLEPALSGTRIAVEGSFNRPPMERTPEIAALFERARAIGVSLGMRLTEGATGGGSDGNFTAALGVPTLDGLGVLGGGAHADTEHIVIDSLSERAALLAALLLQL